MMLYMYWPFDIRRKQGIWGKKIKASLILLQQLPCRSSGLRLAHGQLYFLRSGYDILELAVRSFYLLMQILRPRREHVGESVIHPKIRIAVIVMTKIFVLEYTFVRPAGCVD